MWIEFMIDQPKPGSVLLPDNGWEALILAVAGPRHGVRHPKTATSRSVSVVTSSKARVSYETVPFSDADQEILDDLVDEFLLAAGFDRRPRGYDWYLRLPSGFHTDEELYQRLNATLAEEGTGGHPAQIRLVFERVLSDLYT